MSLKDWTPIPVIDGHIDTAKKSMELGGRSFADGARELNCSYPALLRGNVRVALFAVFYDPSEENGLPEAMQNWTHFFQRNQAQLQQITSVRQLEPHGIPDDRIGVVMHLEGCAGVAPDFKFIDDAYKLGLRSVGLTHFDTNRYGHGAVRDGSVIPGGLTDAGRALIAKCESLGICIDISHANDQTILDIVQVAKRPVFASHCNVRSLSPHGRNLTGELIRAVAETGGTVGIMFSNAFLDSSVDPHSGAVDFARIKLHLDTILKYGGEDALAVGSDYDGATIAPCMRRPEDIQSLFQYLYLHGYLISRLEKLANKNLKRFFGEIWNN